MTDTDRDPDKDADKTGKNFAKTIGNISRSGWRVLRSGNKSQKPVESGESKVSIIHDVTPTGTSSDIASSAKAEAPESYTEPDTASSVNRAIVSTSTGYGDSKAPTVATADDNAVLETSAEGEGGKISTASTEGPKREPEAALNAPVASELAPSLSPDDEVAGFWDAAYDGLKSEKGRLLYAYEKMILQYLTQRDWEDLMGRRSSLATIPVAMAIQAKPLARREQMSQVIDVWQVDGVEDKRVKTGQEAVIWKVADSVKDILRASLQRAEKTHLPWVAACLAIQNSFRSMSTSDATRLGIIDVVSKMEWYNGLSRQVLGFHNTKADEPMDDHVFSSLKDTLVSLYKSILLYLITGALMNELQTLETLNLQNASKEKIPHMAESLLGELQGHKIATQLRSILNEINFAQKVSITDDKTTEEEEFRLRELAAGFQDVDRPPLELKDGKDHVLELIYHWALTTEEYRRFLTAAPSDGDGCRVLWVSGAPGAGKTMLLRATTGGLSQQARPLPGMQTFKLASFFCTSRGNFRNSNDYVMYAIKSLVWQMLKGQPSLAVHLEEKFSTTGRKNFNNANDLYSISTVLYSMLNDPKFGLTYVVVDAIEELCTDDDEQDEPGSPAGEQVSALSSLLKLITKTSEISTRIKWLVSVDHSKIDTKRTPTNGKTLLRLSLDDAKYSEGMRHVDEEYISSKVNEVADSAGFEGSFRTQVTHQLQKLIPCSFLWVTLACGVLKSSGIPWNASSILDGLPKKVPSLYELLDAKLNKNIDNFTPEDHKFCRSILNTAAIAYRPLRISELVSIIKLPPEVDPKIIVEKMCPFLLEIYEDSVCFIHVSARDFVRQSLKQSGQVSSAHLMMTQRCLENALTTDHHKTATSTYATTYWMQHACLVGSNIEKAIEDITQFLQVHFFEWAETLAAQNLLSDALVLLQRLEVFLTTKIAPSPAKNGEQDGRLHSIREALWFLGFHHTVHGPPKLSPKNIIPFLPGQTELKKRLLSTELPWLDTAPKIELNAALGASIHILDGHHDWVRCCTYSPDGRFVATGGDDERVCLWETETFELRHAFSFSSYVYNVVFSPKHLLAAVGYSEIKIWDGSTGLDQRSLVSGENNFSDITFSPSGDKLAAARGSVVILWDVPSDAKTGNWTETVLDMESQEDVHRVRFSLPDGHLLACTASTEIFIWDVQSSTMLGSLNEHEDIIDGLAFSPVSGLLASGSDDKTVRLWDPQSDKSESLCVLRGHESHVNCVSFTHDGSRLASGSSDSSIRIWKLREEGMEGELYQLEQVLKGHSDAIYGLAFAPRGQHLISSSADKTARIWDADIRVSDVPKDQGSQPEQVDGHTAAITVLVFSLDGKKIASASGDGQICLWDGDSGSLYGSLGAHDLDVTSLMFSEQGDTLVSASSDGTVGIWDTEAKMLKSRLTGHDDWVRCAAISPSGQLVASGSDDRTVRVWDISGLENTIQGPNTNEMKRENERVFRGHTDYVYCVTFSSDKRYLASGADDLDVMIWDLTQGEGDKDDAEIVLHSKEPDLIRALAFTPDSSRIVFSDKSGNIEVWDIHRKTCVQVFWRSEEPCFRTLEFDKRSPNVVLTELGAWQFNISDPPALSTTSTTVSDPVKTHLIRGRPQPRCPYGISDDRKWITWNGKDNIFFLPSQYRPGQYGQVTCRVQGNRVVIGNDSGKVLLFKFKEGKTPKSLWKADPTQLGGSEYGD